MAPAEIPTSKVRHGRVPGQPDYGGMVGESEGNANVSCVNWLGLEERGGSWNNAETEGSC